MSNRPTTPCSSVRRSTKRRFPGPAGLLPVLQPKEIKTLGQIQGHGQDPRAHALSQQINKIITSAENEKAGDSSSKKQGHGTGLSVTDSYISSSQDSSSCNWFESPAWIHLLNQLQSKSPNEHDFLTLLNLMNIKWVRTKVTKRANCKKIPFLVVVLHEAPEIINPRAGKLKAPRVTLMDPSGSIEAVIDCKFLLSYSSELVPGTCLALRNVGILRLRRKFLLTITENNLIYMTSCVEDMTESPNSCKKTNSAFVTITVEEFEVRLRTFTDSDFCVDELTKEYHKINQLNRFEDDDQAEDDDDSEDDGPRGRNSLNQSSLFSANSAAATPFRSPVPILPVRAPIALSIVRPAAPIRASTVVAPTPIVSKQTFTTVAKGNENTGFENDFDDDDYDAELLNVLDAIDLLNEPDVF